MNTFVFQPGMTWRKLGFALYSNSLEYRRVLDDNPSWSVTELPPPGTVLRGSINADSAPGASQMPSVFTDSAVNSSADYFPYETPKEYYSALLRYTPSNLRKVDRINGLASDSSFVNTR